MRVSFRDGFFAGAVVALALGIYLSCLWQPERQVRLHTDHLIHQIEDKDWAATADFLAADYRDSWGHDRERLLERLREVLAYTRAIQINPQQPAIRIEGGEGIWGAIVKVDGESGEVMALIKERVNVLGTPFELRWRRQSRKPWDWKLTSVDNPSLQIEDQESRKF